MPRPGIFLDRDDVINKCPAGMPGDPAGFITKWKDFEWYEGVKIAFALMYTMPYQVFVISNQSGVSRENIECTEGSIRKIFTHMESELTEDVNERIKAMQYGIPGEKHISQRPALAIHPGGIHSPMVIHESMFCPHLDEHNCACRKPKPGMIWYLAVKYGIDLSRSWIIGDSDGDIKCGYRAGIRRMIRIDHEAEPVMPEAGTVVKLPKKLSDVLRVPSLLNAVGYIQAYDAYIERVWGPKVAREGVVL